MKNIKSRMNGQQGFTLIEILVVIGLIAILATIVIVAVNPSRQFKQGRDTQRTSNVNAILNAIGQYIADNKGNLPPGIPGDAGAAALCGAIMPTYLPSVPTDPSLNTSALTACPGTTNYAVSVDGNGRVTVTATGELTNPIAVTR